MVATLDLNDEVESKDGESTLHDEQMANSEKCLLIASLMAFYPRMRRKT